MRLGFSRLASCVSRRPSESRASGGAHRLPRGQLSLEISLADRYASRSFVCIASLRNYSGERTEGNPSVHPFPERADFFSSVPHVEDTRADDQLRVFRSPDELVNPDLPVRLNRRIPLLPPVAARDRAVVQLPLPLRFLVRRARA